MKQLRALCLILIFCSMAATSGAQDDPAFKIESKDEKGFLEIDTATGISVATNGVIITYSNVVLTADSASADSSTGDILADGNVTIKTTGIIWSGERIFYNFKTQQMESGQFKAAQAPFFLSGEQLHANTTNHTFSGTNVFATTDDYAEPAYKIRARSLTIVPGKYIEAREATVRIGDVPIFYFPYYRRAIGSRVNQLEFVPGWRTTDGAYLLTTYKWYSEKNFDGAIHLDYREKHGFGVGPDLTYRLGKFGDGNIQYYHLHDDDPGNYPSTTNSIRSDRQRVGFSHQATIRTNLTVKAVLDYQSDSEVEHDFFQALYRENVQPKSFAEVHQQWPNFSLDFMAQPQVNNFQETIQRLPDVTLTGLRQQILETPLYYESVSSAGYYSWRYVDDSTNYAGTRADSFHQILLPLNYFGWLNVTPRVGGRLTYYSETDGPGATTQEQTRSVFNTGSEVSFKSSRVWAGTENKFWDVNGLRHIFEPSVNYVFVPQPSVTPPKLPQYDAELESLRTAPIDFPEYNAIDSIDSQSVLRFGLQNRLQTKREEIVQNFLTWGLVTDWRINPNTSQTTFAPLGSSLEFKPRNWITLQTGTRYDLDRKRMIEADQFLTLEPNNVWSWSGGYRYLEDNSQPGYGQGNNLISSSIYCRLNENWGARISQQYEARTGTMQEQYYTVYRDLRSWTAALTFRVRDNGDGQDDYTVAATFSLKASPRFGLNSDRDKPSQLVGY